MSGHIKTDYIELAVEKVLNQMIKQPGMVHIAMDNNH